jgi:hypothetical protein
MPALIVLVPKWPFATMAWMVLAALPPLVAFYRKRGWRIPWWHWPFAVGHICVAAQLLRNYVDASTWGLYWWGPEVEEWDIVLMSLRELLVYTAWLGIPIFIASAWLTARAQRRVVEDSQ